MDATRREYQLALHDPSYTLSIMADCLSCTLQSSASARPLQREFSCSFGLLFAVCKKEKLML